MSSFLDAVRKIIVTITLPFVNVQRVMTVVSQTLESPTTRTFLCGTECRLPGKRYQSGDHVSRFYCM